MFANTDINVTTEGKRHLGAVAGSRSYTEEYVAGKVKIWSEDIKKLAHIAQTQPHAAYSAYTHGLSSCWSFLSQTIPDIADLLNPLEETIQQHLIPALTGCPPCSREERDLLALPVRVGGMGITNPVSTSHCNFEASTRLTSPLVATIATQDQDRLVDQSEVLEAKASIRRSNREYQVQQAKALPRGCHLMTTIFPSTRVRSKMHCLRYGWKLPNTPTKCSCSTAFSTDHAIICPKGSFPTI